MIAGNFSQLRIALVGDFCLDRYLEIDPARHEISIETGLEVYNVVRVRSQPGAAGTILNNLVALGVGEIYPVGFHGADGEGYELRRALASLPGVHMDAFIGSRERRTFTYCKPLVMEPGRPPRELNRLDSKNWSVTPAPLQIQLASFVRDLAVRVDALILMDQVDIAETGVVTTLLLDEVRNISVTNPELLIIADSRRSLKHYPPVCLKMNAAELAVMSGTPASADIDVILATAKNLATSHGRPVFVTLSHRGIAAASPEGESIHVEAFPTTGEIDVVGAGDSVTANLAAALAAGASLRDALEIAMAAASIVVHQLGTTGTASIPQLEDRLGF